MKVRDPSGETQLYFFAFACLQSFGFLHF